MTDEQQYRYEIVIQGGGNAPTKAEVVASRHKEEDGFLLLYLGDTEVGKFSLGRVAGWHRYDPAPLVW